ncbi:hypothetical protein [Leucobacter massiliensis]|uniref:hypothetical protein n=1 Tax=Leucobacter massiliensis TaxID=1686285 RepID=UPI0011B22CAB|nr:hypothetical protein [Leucobacter massiliensis]
MSEQEAAGAARADEVLRSEAAPGAEGADEGPESVPPKAWVTLVLFAAFVVAFGTCASTFMFD